jgi:hypothetical protein
LRVVDDKVCTSHRTRDVQLGWRRTSDHVCPERYADTVGRTGRGDKKGSTPLPIWTAAIPTPPAAANTSSHSPVCQEVLRIFVNDGFSMRTGLQFCATYKRLVTRRVCYIEPCTVYLYQLSIRRISRALMGTYQHPARTKGYPVEASHHLASQRLAR